MTTQFLGTEDFHHDRPGRIGVLLVNLGTPDAPDATSVRRYLAEFLWDPRIIEMPRILWWLILHGIILRIRPSRSARAYASIWTPEGSPLLVNSKAQARGVGAVLDERNPGLFSVALGMRYGRPSVDDALQELESAGVHRLVVLPLYPQNSGTTTGSVFDAVSQALTRRRWVPHLAFNAGYHDEPAYIACLADSIREAWQHAPPPQRLLFSFHGIPKRYLLAGDPYHCQCLNTARRVAESLELEDDRWQVSFQSRVGREEWLRPYTDETLERWGQKGIETVHVVCPGFAADCLETLEEIAVENRDRFTASGGKDLHYIPALNARQDHVTMLADLVKASADLWLGWAREEARLGNQQPNPRQRAAVASGAKG